VRQNGLRASSFVAVVDVDPRVADQLLDLLRLADVAAYSEPAPGTTGVYRDHQVPTRRLDRLWVDRSETGRAREVLDRAVPHLQAELELVIRDGFAVDGEHRTLLDADLRSLGTQPSVPAVAVDSLTRDVAGEVSGFRPAVLAEEALGGSPFEAPPVPAGAGPLPGVGGQLPGVGGPLPAGADAAASTREGLPDGPGGSGVGGPGEPGVDGPDGSGVDRPGAAAFELPPSRPALVDGAAGTSSGTTTGVGVDAGAGAVGSTGSTGSTEGTGGVGSTGGAHGEDPGRFPVEFGGPGVELADSRAAAPGPGSVVAPADAPGADSAGSPGAAGRAATGGSAPGGELGTAAAGPGGPAGHDPGPGPTSTAGRHAGASGSDDLDDAAVDAAWARIVADFDTPADGDAPWPPTEDVGAARTTRLRRATRPPSAEPAPTVLEVDHFVPPPPPQLPRLDTLTRLGWAALVAGPVLLVLVVVFGRALPGWLPLLGVLTLVGGFALLVSRLRPRDSDDDTDHHDGAVV